MPVDCVRWCLCGVFWSKGHFAFVSGFYVQLTRLKTLFDKPIEHNKRATDAEVRVN
jgi:hypothetical protein